jgi:hypothetical protein
VETAFPNDQDFGYHPQIETKVDLTLGIKTLNIERVVVTALIPISNHFDGFYKR